MVVMKAYLIVTGHTAQSVCVGDITFNCKDEALPSIYCLAIERESSAVLWDSDPDRVGHGHEASSGLYTA